MDFLEKLNYLMDKHHLNKSTLSKSCDIPYTTIDGWYKKGYEGLKLTTLRKLSNFFGTSLDFWANDKVSLSSNNITSYNQCLFVGEKDEIELLTDYRVLNTNSKYLVRGMMKGLAVSEKIANAKGETLILPLPDDPVSEIVKSYEELGPEHQQVILELVEQMLSKQNAN